MRWKKPNFFWTTTIAFQGMDIVNITHIIIKFLSIYKYQIKGEYNILLQDETKCGILLFSSSLNISLIWIMCYFLLESHSLIKQKMFFFVIQAIDFVTNSNNYFSFIVVVATMVIVQQEITLDAWSGAQSEL
jgi:hypothetical protein